MNLIFTPCFLYLQTMRRVFRPTADWGPALDRYREGRYAPREMEGLENGGYQVEMQKGASGVSNGYYDNQGGYGSPGYQNPPPQYQPYEPSTRL